MTTEVTSPIAVVGLGYVGLPLALAFGRETQTIGFDIDDARVKELRSGLDRNKESTPEEVTGAKVEFTSDAARLRDARFIIIAVPTPVDEVNQPDFGPLLAASRTVGANLTRGRIVAYESTVYPGCTEEKCIPILEKESGLKVGKDFGVGYSPERINPGDRAHTIDKIVKIVSGSDPATLDVVARTYSLVAKAGVHRAPDIKTAEAAKVIENIQRDLNIALMNELSVLFHKLGIDTREVLSAARTKWNFLPFQPGLVGGHCIPVDPYYLTYKATAVGYHPEVIVAGRRINDAMGRHVAAETVRLMVAAGKAPRGSRVLVLGLAFKENVRDTRNSRSFDVIRELRRHGMIIAAHDPIVDGRTVTDDELALIADPFTERAKYDAIVVAVPHASFVERGLGRLIELLSGEGKERVFVDVKGVYADDPLKGSVSYWSL
ncbi:MAG: nucleotide sugar dehydrogenase [Euryarchaeota archaeon]|nr:nucleotide sugar dehydrogenase [Euryarchaeota archaeon]